MGIKGSRGPTSFIPSWRRNYEHSWERKDMSILTRYQEAFESGDKEQLDAAIHEDCKFYPHVGGAVMTKSDVMAFASMGAVRSEAQRILFENDEVGVTHSIAHFANGSTSEAVLAFYRFKDGKIIHVETGATPLSDDYKLIGQ
jgi:ketosteroid isomerase-like protein